MLNKMETGTQDVLVQHIAYGFMSTYALEWLKKASWFPFLKCDTTNLNRTFSAVAAFLSSVGIVTAMNGHLSWQAGATITLTIPPLSVVWGTLVHTVGQYGIQEATYKGLVRPASAPVSAIN